MLNCCDFCLCILTGTKKQPGDYALCRWERFIVLTLASSSGARNHLQNNFSGPSYISFLTPFDERSLWSLKQLFRVQHSTRCSRWCFIQAQNEAKFRPRALTNTASVQCKFVIKRSSLLWTSLFTVVIPVRSSQKLKGPIIYY